MKYSTKSFVEALEPRLLFSGVTYAEDGMPLLHSNPDAPAAIFIDFQYESIGGTPEQEAYIPFDLDGDTNTVNAEEAALIESTWAKLASAYAPFDVDVTTVEPADPTPFIWARIANHPSGPGDDHGARTFSFIPTSEYVAVNSDPVFGRVGDMAQPQSFIGQGQIVSGSDTAAHETGHSIGIVGHETADADGNLKKIQETPITAGPFTRQSGPHGSWFNFTSEHQSAINPDAFYFVVDDIEIITSEIVQSVQTWVDPSYSGDGFRPDDHAATPASSTALTWDADASRFTGEGIIERLDDKDMFSFNWSGGTAWVGVSHPQGRSIIDPRMVVTDSNGDIVGLSDSNESQQAALRLNNLAPGTYTIEIASDGDYSELGAYDLTVSADAPYDALRPVVELMMDGNALDDATGQGHEGVWVGSAQWTTGRDGSAAARFDGTNWIQVSNPAGGDFTPLNHDLLGRTISFWFQADALGGGSEQVLFEDPIASPSEGGYRLLIDNGQLKAFGQNDRSGWTWSRLRKLVHLNC